MFNWPSFDCERFKQDEKGSDFSKLIAEPHLNDLFTIGVAFYSKPHIQALRLHNIGTIKVMTESLHHMAILAGKA